MHKVRARLRVSSSIALYCLETGSLTDPTQKTCRFSWAAGQGALRICLSLPSPALSQQTLAGCSFFCGCWRYKLMSLCWRKSSSPTSHLPRSPLSWLCCLKGSRVPPPSVICVPPHSCFSPSPSSLSSPASKRCLSHVKGEPHITRGEEPRARAPGVGFPFIRPSAP